MIFISGECNNCGRNSSYLNENGNCLKCLEEMDKLKVQDNILKEIYKIVINEDSPLEDRLIEIERLIEKSK